MALFISQKLTRVIRQFSYARGRVARATNRIARLRQDIERSEQVRRSNQESADRLALEIKQLAPYIDLDKIRPTKPIATRKWKTGAMNALLIRSLKEAPGALRTTELMMIAARELGIPLTPQENYMRYQETIRRQLARWATMGFVERLHDYTNPRIYGEGRWRWRHQGSPEGGPVDTPNSNSPGR